MVAVPTIEEEDAKRPHRERENLVGETLMHRDKLFAAAQNAHHHPAITIGLIVEIGMCREQSL